MALKKTQSTSVKTKLPTKVKDKRPTPYEDLLEAQMIKAKILTMVREYKFLTTRRFRFDFADVENKLGVEVDGGVFSGGRHTSGIGFSRDCEKFNLAAIDNWSIIRITTQQVKSEQGIDWIKNWYLSRGLKL